MRLLPESAAPDSSRQIDSQIGRRVQERGGSRLSVTGETSDVPAMVVSVPVDDSLRTTFEPVSAIIRSPDSLSASPRGELSPF
jgi:hypothetical protein